MTRYAARPRSEGKEEGTVSFAYLMTVFKVVIATIFSLVFIGLLGFGGNTSTSWRIERAHLPEASVTRV